MDIKTTFFSEFGRLRSGWRFTIFFVSLVLTAVIFLSVVELTIIYFDKSFDPRGEPADLLQKFVFSVTAVFYAWFYGKIFEDLPFRALGAWFTKGWLKDLTFGFVIGATSFSFAALVAFLGGGLKFQFDRDFEISTILLTLGSSLAVFILAAIQEELLFRGYLLQTLARAKLAWTAIILTSVLFASAHIGNHDATFFSIFNTALAGIWLGAAYLKTRNLWFPFGIHLAWNWFQGAIFGIEVSGITQFTTAPFLQEIDKGPAWLTGENYGIEGGIACTIALIVSILIIYFLPSLKPTEEMLAMTSEEKPRSAELHLK